jgi:hypothetical protein
MTLLLILGIDILFLFLLYLCTPVLFTPRQLFTTFIQSWEIAIDVYTINGPAIG